jgi:NAD kinase
MGDQKTYDDQSEERKSIDMDKINIFNSKDEVAKKGFHYAITLGGDGTILYAAKQFTGRYIPPIISFAQVSINMQQ